MLNGRSKNCLFIYTSRTSQNASIEFLELVTIAMIDYLRDRADRYGLTVMDKELKQKENNIIVKNVSYATDTWWSQIAQWFVGNTVEKIACNEQWQDYVLTVYHTILYNIRVQAKLMHVSETGKPAKAFYYKGPGKNAEEYLVEKAIHTTFKDPGYGAKYAILKSALLQQAYGFVRKALGQGIGTKLPPLDETNYSKQIGLDAWFEDVLLHGKCLCHLLKITAGITTDVMQESVKTGADYTDNELINKQTATENPLMHHAIRTATLTATQLLADGVPNTVPSNGMS